MAVYSVQLESYWDIRTPSKGFIPHAAGASVVDQDSQKIEHHFDLDLPGRE